MAVTNPLCTLPQVRSAMGINDTMDDTWLEVCIGAASRFIEDYVGMKIWVDTATTTREFVPKDEYCVKIPEGIADTTGLEVKTDAAGDGTFETTLTLNTDFILKPVNAPDLYPVRPWTELAAINIVFPLPSNERPTVQVTAKFGWPAIPDDIRLAAILLAKDYAKAKDAPFGVAGAADFGVLRIRRNQTVVDILNQYKPVLVA